MDRIVRSHLRSLTKYKLMLRAFFSSYSTFISYNLKKKKTNKKTRTFLLLAVYHHILITDHALGCGIDLSRTPGISEGKMVSFSSHVTSVYCQRVKVYCSRPAEEPPSMFLLG